MEIVKKTDKYTIIKKRSGRFGIRTRNGSWINGEEKVKILVEEGLVKAAIPKKEEPTPEVQEEAPAEETPEAEPTEEAAAVESAPA